MNLPELLAPAGGMAQLKAALRFGADAVYGALPSFGLRAFAGNFTWEELKQALTLLHSQKKKFYLTLNILPYQDEMDALKDAARLFARALKDDAVQTLNDLQLRDGFLTFGKDGVETRFHQTFAHIPTKVIAQFG